MKRNFYRLFIVLCSSVFCFSAFSCGIDTSDKNSGNGSEPGNNVSGKEVDYLFEFDESLNGYVVTGLSDTFIGTVIDIPAEYNGESGKKSVVAIQSKAFINQKQITKAFFPDSVVSVKTGDYTGINQGRIFSGCSALETVVMPGLLRLEGVYNFYNCVSLKEIVVNENFVVKDSQFDVSDNVENYVPQLDVFIASDTQAADFDCRRDENLKTNLMLTGVYYYFDKDGACNTWKYDTDGTPLVEKKHQYDTRGECEECGAIHPEGINYFYYKPLDVYVADGISLAFKGTEVYVKENFDDGINGYKAVKGISAGAFLGCERLTKIVLPSTLTEIVGLGGRIFERCLSMEYVSMTGIGGFSSSNRAGNCFLDCINLKTLILNAEFRNEVQTFYVREFKYPDYVGQVDVYINADRKGLNFAANNTVFTNNNMFSGKQYLYSATKPSGQDEVSGNWWHWVDGVPTPW